MFMIRMPDNFTPEDYGWERQDDFDRPYQQHERFGVWRRKREPYQGFESLVICRHDEPSDAFGALFHPLPLPETMTGEEGWDRLRDDPRGKSL